MRFARQWSLGLPYPRLDAARRYDGAARAVCGPLWERSAGFGLARACLAALGIVFLTARRAHITIGAQAVPDPPAQNRDRELSRPEWPSRRPSARPGADATSLCEAPFADAEARRVRRLDLPG
jgi:hypothetical protein